MSIITHLFISQLILSILALCLTDKVMLSSVHAVFFLKMFGVGVLSYCGVGCTVYMIFLVLFNVYDTHSYICWFSVFVHFYFLLFHAVDYQ